MYILTATNIQNNVYYNIGKLLSKETLKSLERTIKEGSLTYYVTTAIVQGEARVGKTCLKSLILSLPYDKVSTSCIEAPCIACYGNFSVEHYASSDSIGWKLVNDDEMDKKIIAEIQERAKEHTVSPKKENPPKNEAIPNEESDEDSITDFDLLTVTSESEDELHMVSSDDAIPENMPSRVMSQKELKNNNQDHNDDYRNKMVDTTTTKQTATKSSIFEDCLKKHSISRFGSHKRWLYFIDSGGQIQFQKLLLAFMPFTSVLFLVVKLSKNLSGSSCQSIQLPNETVGDNEPHGMKVEEVLKQILSAVASNTQRYHQSLVNDYIKHPTGRLQVITVGTYHDKYVELITCKSKKIESIEEKEMKLFNIIDSVSSICDTSHILHKLDGRKATRGDFKDKVVETIAQSLHDKAYEVKVPLKWHYFGVLLRKEAKDSNGVLAKSSCEEYGRLLDMSVKDVNSALDFFHTLKMLFYYPDSQAKDIVFVKLDSLINIIRELVIAICQFHCDEKRLPKQQRPQVAKGYLPVSLIESTEAFKKIKNIPNLSMKLLDLFKHLKIAAQLDEDENKDTLVMPALLPIKNLSDDKALSITAQPPLLFYFNNAVPMGLFCAVMVHLVNKKEWRITYEDNNFSNYFTFEKDIIETGRSLTVVIIEKFNCIEIHCTSSRHLIKEDIYKAINEVTKHTHIDYETPEAAFYCPCNGKRDHVARVKKNVFLICDNTGKNQNNIMSDDEQEQYWSWFMDKQEIEVMKSERREDFCNNERKQQSTCKCILIIIINT